MTEQNETHGDSPTWIAIITTSIPEATMIAERLRSLGIPAMMHHEAGASAFALSVGSYGQARVLVPESFFNRAAGLLESDPALLDEPEDEDDGSDEYYDYDDEQYTD